ncbi:DEAD/DEAH box helicase [Mesoplasma tabanidae]|uniref:Type III restriction protein res subunit n=1 Tax=Mesoplasma tabanidae TaxID=219745 RepID=A0A2K8P7A9_9MOLU|nr:DEAD/DEAH box helicase family protein [Mesoplasma tabanidae]ATZ21495.1 type III restriction protein res subunit [Mesoplasma tabanidae]
MELLNFQKNIISKAIKTLQLENSFTFQAPTGTGKTFVIANLISEMILNYNVLYPNEEFTFIFIAPSAGELYSQSYEKMALWMDKKNIKSFNIINNKSTSTNSLIMPYRIFEKDSVYFFGWSSLAKKDNKITTEISENNTFWKTLDRTKNQKRKVVLIIDEAHLNNTKIGKDFISKIEPDKVIKMSATISKNEKIDYKVSYSMAIEEKIVKKNFSINSDLKISNPSWREYISSAISKQKEIKNAYRINKIFQNPLILIQIPDMKSNTIIDENIIFDYLVNYLKIPNHKIAIYLDKVKTHTKEEINTYNSEIDILIFKQAIATGWDIPRANMYVRLRSIKEENFKIQSIGRVLRNPLLKYYNNELIDNCFVYTDSDELIQEMVINFSEQINKRDFFVKENFKEQFENPINIVRLKYNLKFDRINTSEVVQKFVSSEQIIANIKKTIDDNSKNNFSYVVSYNESIENLAENKKMKNEWLKGRQLQLNSNNLTLLEIKNLALFKYKNNSYFEIINILSKELSVKFNIKIKDLFYTMIKVPTFRKEIEEIIFSIIKNSLIIEKEKFLLPKIMQYDAFSLGQREDYNLTPYKDLALYSIEERKKDFDSDLEQNFYNFLTEIKDKYKLNLIFRNSTDQNSYFFNYVSSSGKIRKFYPDFIIKQNNKYIICDTKDEFYDDEIEEKKQAFSIYKDFIINENYNIIFGMVYKKGNNKYELRNNDGNFNIESIFLE